MADNAWSQSTCRADVWWYGVPGSGCWYWTQRFGQYWVSGGVHQTYANNGWECGWLGAPVKSYQWLSEFSAYGQWFEGGAIYYANGSWRVFQGDMGQTAGRDADVSTAEAPADAETPPKSDLPVEVDAPAPPTA